MRRLPSCFAFRFASPGRFGQRDTTLSSTGGTNGFAHVENIVSCVLPGLFLPRFLFHPLYESKICSLFPLDGRLGGFKLQTPVSLPYLTKSNSGRTLRFTPFSFFSPSKVLSNLPMLAVLTREVASVLLISFFRCSLDEGPTTVLSPWACAIFCVIRRSF